MAFKDSNGNLNQPGTFIAWIDTLAEPQRAQYQSINQARIDSGNETEEFARIWAEFVTATGLIDSPEAA
jgi:hypothetical protein